MKYSSTAVLVSDIKESKRFYHEILGLEIMMDNGEHIAFMTGLSIWDRVSAGNTIFNKPIEKSDYHKVDLCFDSEDIREDYAKLQQSGVEILNQLAEQPWGGQFACRVLDPDGNIIEVAEKISDTFKRLLDSGLTMKEVSEKTFTSEADINKIIGMS